MKPTQTPPFQQAIVKEPNDIGTLIRNLRKELAITQAKAAAMCNVGTRFFSDLENGKPTLQIAKTLKVLTAFGLVVTIKRKGTSIG